MAGAQASGLAGLGERLGGGGGVDTAGRAHREWDRQAWQAEESERSDSDGARAQGERE